MYSFSNLVSGAQSVKGLPTMWKTRVQPLGQEDSPGEGSGNPLQYSCLENSMEGGAWWGTAHGVTKSLTWETNTLFNLEEVHWSMSSSNCFFLTCMQVSQEAGKVVLYPHLFKNFPQFVMIYTVKGFGVVNKAEVDVFLEFSCFFYDPVHIGNLISGIICLK